MKTYSGPITSLPPNGVFVFGSNTEGRHGKGAALVAKNKFGANPGQAKGLQGNSYAIITKDLRRRVHPSRTMWEIEEEIAQLYDFAVKHPELDFYVAYSAGGQNLNGYDDLRMAFMFGFHEQLPENIIFEEMFGSLVETCHNDANPKIAVV